MEPTKEQLDKFWEEASEYELRYLLKYAKDKEVRDKANKLYPWNKVGKDKLRDLLEFALDKEVRDKAKELLNPVNPLEYLLNK